MTDDDDIDDLVEAAEPEFMQKWNNRRQRARAQVDYDRSLLIREAGELFRAQESVQKVADELGIEEGQADEAIRLYIYIFSSDFEGDILPGMEAGIQFFRGSYSPEALLESTTAESTDDIQERVREFVGSVMLTDPDLESVNLSTDIPENPVRSTPREEMAEDPLQAALQSLRNPLEEVDITSLTTPSLRIDEIFSQVLVGDKFEEIIESMQEQIQSTIENIQVVIERQRELERTLREGISNFEHPEEYSPTEIEVSADAERIAVQMLEKHLVKLEETDTHDAQPYYNRMRIGLNCYQDGDYMLSIFLFLSVQDGLLGMLVEEFGTDGNLRQVKRKELAFKQGYRHFLLSGEEAATTWSDFWQHRNAIMHGDKDVYFDRNIATISLLFLNLALYSVLEVLNESDVE